MIERKHYNSHAEYQKEDASAINRINVNAQLQYSPNVSYTTAHCINWSSKSAVFRGGDRWDWPLGLLPYKDLLCIRRNIETEAEWAPFHMLFRTAWPIRDNRIREGVVGEGEIRWWLNAARRRNSYESQVRMHEGDIEKLGFWYTTDRHSTASCLTRHCLRYVKQELSRLTPREKALDRLGKCGWSQVAFFFKEEEEEGFRVLEEYLESTCEVRDCEILREAGLLSKSVW